MKKKYNSLSDLKEVRDKMVNMADDSEKIDINDYVEIDPINAPGYMLNKDVIDHFCPDLVEKVLKTLQNK